MTKVTKNRKILNYVLKSLRLHVTPQVVTTQVVTSSQAVIPTPQAVIPTPQAVIPTPQAQAQVAIPTPQAQAPQAS